MLSTQFAIDVHPLIIMCLHVLTSSRSVWAQGTFVSGWTIATLTSGSIFPPSTRHMECGAPLSRTTTRSILRARWSTYTLDTSGCWGPWMIHRMNATHVSWDTQHMYRETRNTCIMRHATHVSCREIHSSTLYCTCKNLSRKRHFTEKAYIHSVTLA